jgi:antitoxin CptB
MGGFYPMPAARQPVDLPVGIYAAARAFYMLAIMTDSEDSSEITRKRLLFRSWHRGTREMDLLLGRFAERNLPTFSERQVALYEALLEYSDSDIYDWMNGRTAPPKELDHDVMKLLLNFRFTDQ